MPVLICVRCGKPAPDSFHNFKEICGCKTKEEWIALYKRKRWHLRIGGKEYDFTKKETRTIKK